MYMLNLAEDGRIMSACVSGSQAGGTGVERLPQGDITDYLYVNGEYVFSPQPPAPEPENPRVLERIAALEKALGELSPKVEGVVNSLREGKSEIM